MHCERGSFAVASQKVCWSFPKRKSYQCWHHSVLKSRKIQTDPLPVGNSTQARTLWSLMSPFWRHKLHKCLKRQTSTFCGKSVDVDLLCHTWSVGHSLHNPHPGLGIRAPSCSLEVLFFSDSWRDVNAACRAVWFDVMFDVYKKRLIDNNSVGSISVTSAAELYINMELKLTRKKNTKNP